MIDFKYRIIKHPRRKSPCIVVTGDNDISVRIPRWYTKKDAENIISQNIEWVKKRLRINSERKKKLKPRRYTDGELFLFLGEQYRLRIVTSGRKAVLLKEGTLEVRLPFGHGGNGKEKIIISRLTEWYKIKASEIISQRVEFYVPIVPVRPAGVRIKTLKTLWGSCTSRDYLSFSWKIVMAPMHIIDYLVVHELCHLLHRNHSKKFWKLVDSIIPDYKERNEWLKTNGNSLTL